jgi:hypothetical protein
MDHFTPVDTLDASNYLRANIGSDLNATIHFIMPVTGFENSGQSLTPEGFGKTYGMYLTLDGTDIANSNGSLNHFTSLNATLWLDPKNDAGTPTVSPSSDPSFLNGNANDIVLATGTFVSGSMSLDPTSLVRSADLVERMTPTLDGTILLGGSIQPGSLLEEKTNAPLDTFSQTNNLDGSIVTTVSGGTAQITLDPQGTILIPNITHDQLQLADTLRFIHGNHDGHHGGDGRRS